MKIHWQQENRSLLSLTQSYDFANQSEATLNWKNFGNWKIL